MIKPLKVINTDSPELKFLQDNIDYSLRSVAVQPMISGNILSDVAVSTSSKNVMHGLDRPWNGFFITKSVADVRIYWDATTDGNKRKESTIALKGSATATVDIYIF